MTPPEFAPIWVAMLRAWPAAKPIEGTSTEYARQLADFTTAEVALVVDALILECEWIPSIATVWQRCLDARDDTPAWEDAWQEAQDHASGPSSEWSHETVRQAARAIGMYEIRSTTSPATVRAQFRDIYLDMLKRRRREFATSARELPPPPEPARPALEARR